MGPLERATARGPSRERRYLAENDAGTAELREERRFAEMAADSVGAAAGDSAEAGCVAEYAGVGEEPAAERSEFYAGNERRRPADFA